MFNTINGVQIREYNETKDLHNVLDKRFEIEYLDNVYLRKLVCLDLINVNVKGYERKVVRKKLKDLGRHWIFVVKDNDYAENRNKYGEICCIIHDKTAAYLAKEYGYNPEGMRLVDSKDSVYKNS